MKEETWQESDEKALMVIQLYLADEVLYQFSMEKTASSLQERLQDHYMKKVKNTVIEVLDPNLLS